jgi:hypothetical protein
MLQAAEFAVAYTAPDGLDAWAFARDSSTNNKNRFGRNALWGFT